jgi:hypothetical protein
MVTVMANPLSSNSKGPSGRPASGVLVGRWVAVGAVVGVGLGVAAGLVVGLGLGAAATHPHSMPMTIAAIRGSFAAGRPATMKRFIVTLRGSTKTAAD